MLNAPYVVKSPPEGLTTVRAATSTAARRPYRGQTLTPPDDLPAAALASALGHSWSMTIASMDYRAIGPVPPAPCWKHRQRQVLGAPEFLDQARHRLWWS